MAHHFLLQCCLCGADLVASGSQRLNAICEPLSTMASVTTHSTPKGGPLTHSMAFFREVTTSTHYVAKTSCSQSLLIDSARYIRTYVCTCSRKSID